MDLQVTRAGSALRQRDGQLLDKRSFDGLCSSGFTSREAGQLAARLLGLPGSGRWTWGYREVQHLDFLRWLVESGRLES